MRKANALWPMDQALVPRLSFPSTTALTLHKPLRNAEKRDSPFHLNQGTFSLLEMESAISKEHAPSSRHRPTVISLNKTKTTARLLQGCFCESFSLLRISRTFFYFSRKPGATKQKGPGRASTHPALHSVPNSGAQTNLFGGAEPLSSVAIAAPIQRDRRKRRGRGRIISGCAGISPTPQVDLSCVRLSSKPRTTTYATKANRKNTSSIQATLCSVPITVL